MLPPRSRLPTPPVWRHASLPHSSLRSACNLCSPATSVSPLVVVLRVCTHACKLGWVGVGWGLFVCVRACVCVHMCMCRVASGWDKKADISSQAGIG